MISLVTVANLAGTALTITIQRDWIVSLTGDNRGQLAGEHCHPHQFSDGQRSRGDKPFRALGKAITSLRRKEFGAN